MSDYQLSQDCLIPNDGKMEDQDTDNCFTRDRILILLELYKLYKPQVGRGEIKTIKKNWEKISVDLSNRCRITIHPSKCENKFKVLERSYKKVVDNNTRTGRGRKDFPYENEFNDIFGKKLNIMPKILLNSSEVIVPARTVLNVIPTATPGSSKNIPEVTESFPSTSHELNQDEHELLFINLPARQEEPKRKRKRPSSSYTKRNDILTDIKNDLKAYYAEKLSIQREKLEIAKEKLKDKKERTRLLQNYFGGDNNDTSL